MSNSNVLVDKLAKTSLALLTNSLVFTKLVNRDYENQFTNEGDTVKVRRPVDFTVRTGEMASVQDIVRGTVDVKIDSIAGVDMQFGGKELALEVPEMIRALDLDNAMARVAQKVDQDGFALYKKIPNWAGTAGQTINSASDLLVAAERLTNLCVPMNERNCILSPADYYATVGANILLYAQQGAATDALRKAKLGPIADLETYQSQMVPTHTRGSATSSGSNIQVDGASQVSTYSSVKTTMTQNLAMKTLTNGGTVVAGDVFTIAGVYDVNPATKETLTYLKQFTVITGFTAASNIGTAVISPAIITSGAYQNVSAAPADGAVITINGTASTGYKQNIAFHPSAFTVAFRPMAKIDAKYEAYATDDALGISIKVTRDGDIINNRSVTRLDVLYGWTATRPELATRISGTA